MKKDTTTNSTTSIFIRFATASAAALAMAASLVGCATNETQDTQPPSTTISSASGQTSAAALSGTLNAGGASSQTAAQEAWRADFQNANPQVTVNYDPTGSGTGVTNFINGGYALAGTDTAIASDAAKGPFAACAPTSGLVEVPAYISPIAIGFNLPDIASLKLDPASLAGIFTGAITTWDDPAITAQNPGVTLPSTKITAVHRGDKSGTTANFTDYLAQTGPAAWTFGSVEMWPQSLQGESADKTQGVREVLASTVGAIGYLDASQATAMGIASIKVGSSYVAPSAAGAAATVGASQQESGRGSSDIVIKLDRTSTDPSTYPLVLISYLVACEQYSDTAQGQLVKAYLDYVVSAQGQQAAASNAGSAPTTGDTTLDAKIRAAIASVH
ncbi:MAG: phosphate ABC transporter substrate-binding protein PstS [Propionibacteriaceae bacterium]|jgi:phosphate transport system substrate-binding protein|nr:phosphate ABC transporter substrate-binding protein PstS [Propionibacteriaceae bacterium]